MPNFIYYGLQKSLPLRCKSRLFTIYYFTLIRFYSFDIKSNSIIIDKLFYPPDMQQKPIIRS